MWTCVKCKQPVDDQYTVCPHCGASRSAGRFSRGIRPQQTPQAQYTPDFSHVKAGKGFMLLGICLIILLPALTIMAAVIFHDSWILPLSKALHPNDLGFDLTDFKTNVLYVAFTAGAVLLSALPGVHTLFLGKLLRRLNRMEELL